MGIGNHTMKQKIQANAQGADISLLVKDELVIDVDRALADSSRRPRDCMGL